MLLSQASILPSIIRNKKEKKRIDQPFNISSSPISRYKVSFPWKITEKEREREKEHFSPYRNDEKRICIRVSVFKLSQWRVYMEIPRAMSPTKVPGIELNITVAQRWSSNRLPMVKWKYSWRNVCIFPSSFLTRATRFIKIAFCAFRPPLHSTRVVIHRVYIFLFHVHFRNLRNLENFVS